MIVRLFLLLIVIGLLVPFAPGPAAAQSLDEYRAFLEQTIVDLQSGDADLDAVIDRLRAAEPVTLANGSEVRPELSLVVDALRRDPPDIDAAVARLQATLATLDAANPARFDNARDTLTGVLDRPEFDPQPERDNRTLTQRLLGPIYGWITDALSWLFNRIFGSAAGPAGTGQVLLALAVVAVIGALAVYVVRNVRRTMAPAVVSLPNASRPSRQTSADLRAEAETLAGQGAFRAALRALYIATLMRWDEMGRLRFDRSLTNRETLRRARVQGDPALAEHLGPLVERFDRVWYGGAPCTADDYAEFSHLAGRAWEAA